jgi:phospholipid-transporting ATPase
VITPWPQAFASEGLRTLCLAVAELREADYQQWVKSYEAAATALVDRAARLDEAAEMVRLWPSLRPSLWPFCSLRV